MKNLFFIVAIVISIVLFFVFGRDKACEYLIKFLPPICIIAFWLLKCSLIVSIYDLLNIKSDTFNQFSSASVAVDSAIITLFINSILVFLITPISVTINAQNPRNLTELETYMKKERKVDFNICVNYRKKYLKKFANKVKIRIYNTRCTSIAIDKVDEYFDFIDDRNSSKYIDIDLARLVQEKEISGKIYFKLVIISNKSIEWDETLRVALYGGNFIQKILFTCNDCKMNLVHRKEK